MTLTLYQIDAFTSKLFGGNPAAVIPLDKWLDDVLMQKIALEHNLSETVFLVPVGGNSSPFGGGREVAADFEIRWFTPEVEINLCGHATLASAWALFNILNFDKPEIRFSSLSGILKVTKEDDLICMDFPSWKPERLDIYPDELSYCLDHAEIVGVYKHRDILVELMNEDAVLVDFFATWCGPCKMLTPVLESVANKLDGKVKIVKVDVDESPDLAQRYGIMSVPTMILFKKGQQTAAFSGYMPEAMLMQNIESKL